MCKGGMGYHSCSVLLLARRRICNYGRCMFEPLVVETLGIFNMPARQLLTDLGRRISHISGDVGQAT